MRILRIRGCNLASLADAFEVDLEGGALGRTGLFAITGPTGAGKTTLLDAMCLALFGRTPRLENRGGVAVGRADEPEKERLRSQDARSVMRRGAKAAYAEVVFEGREGRCRARWSVRRARPARGRALGTLQAETMEAWDDETGRPLAGRKTEVLDVIEARLGLGFDQFRRSVLLAQGDFAAFLDADEGERADLLEQMTGTEIYAELSRRAFQRDKEEVEGLEELGRDVERLRVMTSGEREQREAGRERLDAALAGVAASLDAARVEVAWHGTLRELAAEESAARESVAAAAARRESASALRREVGDARAVEPLREAVATADRLSGESSRAAAALARLRDQWVAADREAAGLGVTVERDRAAAKRVTSAREAAAGLRERRVRLQARRDRLLASKALAESASRLASDRSAALAAAAAARDSVDEAAGGAAEARDAVAAAEARLGEARLSLERAMTRRDLGTLRRDLVEGEPCPLCGSREHPWVSPGAVPAGEVEEARHRVERLAAAEAEARTRLASEVARGEGLRAVAAREAERADACARDAESIERQWREGREDGFGDVPAATGSAAVDARIEAVRREIEEVDRGEEEVARLAGTSVEVVRAGLDAPAREAAVALERSTAALAAAREEAAALGARVRDAGADVSDREATRDRAVRDVADRIAAAGLDEAEVRRRLAADPEWLAEAERSLAAIDREAEEARVRLEDRTARRARHEGEGSPSRAGPESMAALQALAAEERGLLDARARLLGELAADDAARGERDRLGADLEARRARAATWRALSDVIGSADGKKFRVFAQGLTLERLVAEANARLREIHPRYALERVPGTDLELQVVDLAMGDEVRGARSLSGGESFLVSLALALGLSTLSSGRTSVGSLFVDEGFGSLDTDTLDAAIAALDALQATGRKVGIISHVPGIAERIGAHVRVEALGGGRSRVLIVDAHGGGYPWP
jgi:exonuclease SbcC